MKAYCKRTYFKKDISNGGGKEFLAYKRGKTYLCKKPGDHLITFGVFMLVKSEKDGKLLTLTQKEYSRYFMNIDELRNKKINEILN